MIHNEKFMEFRTFCVNFPTLQAYIPETIWKIQIKSVSLQH